MSDEKSDPKKPLPFGEVNMSGARTRNKRGQFSGLGAPADTSEVKAARAAKIRDYRKFLESLEPTALRVLEAALRDKDVPIKERKEIAMDVLNRLHGKVLVPQEAEEAKRRVEQMSSDELREFVMDLAGEMGMKMNVPSSQVIN